MFSHNAPGQAVNLSNARDIAGGGRHALPLLDDQTVVAWGHNNHGRLGNGTHTDSGVPVRVEGLNKVVAIAAGLHHSLALREDGTVWAWGHNASGRLGDGTSAGRNVPAPVARLSGITAIAAGGNHNLALNGAPGSSDSIVKAWGHNEAGQLGDSTTENRNTPVDTALTTGSVAPIGAGADHGLAVTGTDQALSTRGENTSGQLGDGTTDYRTKPVPVRGLTGIQLIAAGREHTAILLSDNTVRPWGANGSGQFANGTTTDSTTPVTSLTALTGTDKLAAPVGGDFSLASSPGTPVCPARTAGHTSD
ncbi:RCC1 domain-containing protein [Streptomyces arenae]|uniref:RCC1 domain-containing protein n=1 Tax=Streptomyces arenae TaxID=29301 RepID=UPI003D2C4BE1|nr:hypothetical protein [Streptomyces arenae]